MKDIFELPIMSINVPVNLIDLHFYPNATIYDVTLQVFNDR